MEEVVDELEHCGIAGALVCHGLAREYDCAYGNRLLLTEITRQPRLLGCAVLLPPHAAEMPEPARLVPSLWADGFVAAKVFPALHRFALDERTCGSLLRALEGERMPLLVQIDQTSWADLGRLCEAYPRLPLLLQKVVWDQERQLLPLMEAFDNLYIEFSSLQSNDVLERMTGRFGPERLLFGTEVPTKSPGAARALVDYARIGEEDRGLIAGGNLSRLLGVVPPPLPLREDDPILARVKQGLPLTDVLVIDSHAHVVHDGGEGVGTMSMPHGDARRMLEIYDTFGCARTCLISWLQIIADAERGNAITARAVERWPDRVVGYVSIDPAYTPDVRAAAERWHGLPGMWGVKPYYPRMRVPYDDQRYRPWWELAQARRLFALLHPSGADFARQVGALAAAHPDVSFLLAHSAGTWQFAREHAAIARGRPNVYLEITLTPVPLGSIEYLVSQCGADHVIFGTDAPMRDPRPQFGWLCYARLEAEEKRLILGENMRRILSRVRA